MSAPDLWAERFQSQALRIQTLEARCAELEGALRRYGKHESECQVGYALGCTCGLAAALSADGGGGDE